MDIFNHYIMRRENLNQIQNKLPIGQFNMSISSVACDTVYDTISDTVNISSSNIYIDNSDTTYDSVSDNSKKENLNKKLNNKDLYVHVTNY